MAIPDAFESRLHDLVVQAKENIDRLVVLMEEHDIHAEDEKEEAMFKDVLSDLEQSVYELQYRLSLD